MIPSYLPPIANHLWQSTLFVGIAGLLTLLLRNNRAQVRYGLWLAASAKFLVPLSVLVFAGGEFTRHIAIARVQSPARSDLPLLVEQVNEPFGAQVSLSPVSASHQARFAGLLVPILAVVWTGGFAIVILSWGMRWRKLRSAIRAASPMPLAIGVPVLSSASFFEPGVFGVFHPLILLPDGIATRLTPAELRAILAHELSHVRRRDNLAAVMHMAVEAVLWFYPLVWWLGARLMDERERACDEEVLLAGNQPEAYAEGILKICELYLESPLPCVPAVTGANLRNRIEKIMARRIGRKLNLARKAVLTAALLAAVTVPITVGILNAPALRAQPAAPPAPKFEVASIRVNRSGEARVGGGFQPGGRYHVTNYTLRALIASAYFRPQVNPGFLIEGGPKWIDSEHFDIDAKTSAEVPAGPEGPSSPRRRMLQALLAERFNLETHDETRQEPIYALVFAKSEKTMGPQLHPSSVDCAAAQAGAVRAFFPRIGPGAVAITGTTLTQFVSLLPRFVNRVVRDSTGLTGCFDIQLTWTPAPGEWVAPPPPGQSASPPAAGPSIFTAVREQLGLKLEPRTGPVDILVIDHVEMPSEN